MLIHKCMWSYVVLVMSQPRKIQDVFVALVTEMDQMVRGRSFELQLSGYGYY